MASYVLLTLDGNESQVRSATTYVIINTIESVVLLVADRARLRVDGHAQHGRAARPARRARPRAADRAAAAAAHRLRAEGCGVPAVLLAAGLVPDRAQPDHRGLRRACSPRSASTRSCAPRRELFPNTDTHAAAVDRRRSRWSSACSARSPRTRSSGSCRSTSSARSATWCFGVAIGGVAAIAATIFFLIHQIPIKTSLFLVEGMIEHSSGTSRLDRLSGLAAPVGLPRAAVPRCRRSACRASRRSPASSPSSGS